MKTVFLLTLKSATKDIYMLFWSILLPIIALVLTRIFLPDYSAYVMPAIVAISVFFYSFISTAFVSLADRRRGVYHLLYATPMPLYKYILGVASAWAFISLCLGYMILIIGMIINKFPLSFINIIKFFPIIFIGSLSYIFLSFIFSSLVKNEGHLSMSTNLAMLPMFFLGSSFYSLDNAPHFVQYLSFINPFEWFVIGIRASIHSGIAASFYSVGMLSIFLILFLILSLRTFKYE